MDRGKDDVLVLDAVRISGRWVSLQVLERLSCRSMGAEALTRREIVRQFCGMTGWVNGKGEPCLSSANVALKRLELQGRVKLPPPEPRASRKKARQLVDDKKPLPPLPQLPRSVEQINQLELQLVKDAQDPDHLLWNRLMVRNHPLKGAPLVGWQLRYLIRSEHGVIGAFGFGPAAFHLECRDGWIGWDRQAHQQNRSLVICLSRFLIRPELHCANLASRAYSLVLERVGADWQARYGVKPVLVETYVDRSTYTGKSLSAANWRRLGESSGRGRSSPSRKVCPKTPKDVWVRELHGQARPILRSRRAEPILPRSIFSPESSAGWVSAELDSLDLKDARLDERWAKMLQDRWNHPQRSFANSFGGMAGAKAAYRLVESRRAQISFQNLLEPHLDQTHRRMAAESVVLLAQDTTPLSYNGLLKTKDLGSMGKEDMPGRGLWLHTLQAFRLDGIPLGCAWAHLWARPWESDTAHRNEQSIAEKESTRWMEAYQRAIYLAQAMAQTQLIVCGDRESDIFELHDQSQTAPKNLHHLVRAQHDRLLESGEKLWDCLAQTSVGGTLEVHIPRNKNRPARTTLLSLKWTQIRLNPPQVALKKSWQPINLYVVMAQELEARPGVEPIEWVLLTDIKIASLKMAQRLIRTYSLRWGIECWHQVIKDVCRVETRQMESARALERSLVLDMVVAWRAQFLCRLGKQSPNLPASLYYGPEELAVLKIYRAKLPQQLQRANLEPIPASTPTENGPVVSAEPIKKKDPLLDPSAASSELSLLQANFIVAILAGFLARKSDGHPGPKTLARGLEILRPIVEFHGWMKLSPAHTPRSATAPPREPDG